MAFIARAKIAGFFTFDFFPRPMVMNTKYAKYRINKTINGVPVTFIVSFTYEPGFLISDTGWKLAYF
jgi:hypothetical protein